MHIKETKLLKEFDRGDGICKYLTHDKKCAIYEERPDVCRIDKMYKKVYYKYFSKREFYIKNAQMCNFLQEIHNIDESYRINIKEIECYLG